MNIKAQGGDVDSFLKDVGAGSVQDFVKSQLVTRKENTIAQQQMGSGMFTTKRAFLGSIMGGFDADEVLPALQKVSATALTLVDEKLSSKRRKAVQLASKKMDEVDAEDFTIKAHPADTITVMGGTQIGNDVVEKLDQVITAINNMGGDIIMDGKKVGRQIARTNR